MFRAKPTMLGLAVIVASGLSVSSALAQNALLETKVICNQDGNWQFSVTNPVNADVNLYIASTRGGSNASQWLTGKLTKDGEDVRTIAPDHGTLANDADLQEYMPVMHVRLTPGEYSITLHGANTNATFKRLGVNVSVHGTSIPGEVFRGAATGECVTP